MKPTKAIITMFFMLLLTLALVRGYGDLINYGVGYFNVQITGSIDELMNDESATRTVNPDGTITIRQTEKVTPEVLEEIEKRTLNRKLRFAFIMAAFVLFFVLIYLLAVVSVVLVKRFGVKNQTYD